MKKILGILLIALALAIAIIPQYTNCSAEGNFMKMANGLTVPMKCHWTARAEIALGVSILAIGLMLLFVQKQESLRYLGVLGIILGVFVILLPTSLIGVCDSAMLCDTVMKPALITLGSLVIAGSLAGLLLSLKKGD